MQAGSTLSGRWYRNGIVKRIAPAGILLAVLASAATAQSVDFRQFLVANDITALHEHDGRLFAGVANGGLLVGDTGSPGEAVRWMAGEGLSGNDVTDISWSGRHLWVATRGDGMTRISDPAGTPVFRQYASNLGSMDISVVTGAVVEDRELVYYGMEGGGVGEINDSLSGRIYSAEQDGLISNDVTALQIFGDELFVGTSAGVSRFVDDLFIDANDGLVAMREDIGDFALDADGSLLAATGAGVRRWSPETESWLPVGTWNARVRRITVATEGVYAAGPSNDLNYLALWSGSVWNTLALPGGVCDALYAGTELWIGGTIATATSDGSHAAAYLGRLETGGSFFTWSFDASQVLTCEGVTFGTDGRAWMGDWGGRKVSATDGSTWTHIWEAASADNDSSGLFRLGGNMLSMATGPSGLIWIEQYYSGGILRHDPVTGRTDGILPDNSGLSSRTIVNMVTHPDGPLIVMHDAGGPGDLYVEKVEVLVDPDAWRNPDNWMTAISDGELGDRLVVWDAVVERRDVIWFAVQNVGLVRWDINGDQYGPDGPLTWTDTSDDRWDDPIRGLFGTVLDLGKAFGLALGRDGSLWAGGNGLVQFSYDEVSRRGTLLTAVGGKSDAVAEGLVSASVADIAIDANGHVWAATRTGLNRVRGTGQDFTVDAWTDLANYFGNPVFASLYSTNVIAPLPGDFYRKIVASAGGKKLLLSGDQGVTLLTVGAAGTASGPALDGVYCYPNPWLPDQQVAAAGRLRLGGLPAGVDTADPATVEVYNLEGQLVYRNEYVVPDAGVWDGTNRIGSRVTTGMYVVRVSWRGLTSTITLAVVR